MRRWSLVVGRQERPQAFATGERLATDDHRLRLQLLNRNPVIGIDAHPAGNLHCFFGNFSRRELGVIGQGLRCCLGKRAAGTDRRNAGIGLDHISLAAEQEGSLLVGDQEQGFQMPQKFIGAPIFRKFDGGAAEAAVILLQLGLETAEQSESVGRRAGKSGKNLVLIEAANLPRPVPDDRFTERDLSIARHDDFVIAANAEDSGGADSAAGGGVGGVAPGGGDLACSLHWRRSLLYAAGAAHSSPLLDWI